jgi:hypothetical protein
VGETVTKTGKPEAARAVEADNGEAAGHGDDRHGRLAADILLTGDQSGSIIAWLYLRSSTSRMNRCRWPEFKLNKCILRV